MRPNGWVSRWSPLPSLPTTAALPLHSYSVTNSSGAGAGHLSLSAQPANNNNNNEVKGSSFREVQELEEGEYLETEEDELESITHEGRLELLKLPRATEQKAHPIRYFSDSILEMNPAKWNKLAREEREQVLFAFWMQTSWGKGFPWTMNLFLEKDPTVMRGVLPAFMLLFSEGRSLKKKCVNWRIIRDEGGVSIVECSWQDQWNQQHCVQGTGGTLALARTCLARKALDRIFCSEDLRVLQHVHSPFIYGGTQPDQVRINLVWNRLKEAKLREKRERQLTTEGPEVRQCEPLRMLRTDRQIRDDPHITGSSLSPKKRKKKDEGNKRKKRKLEDSVANSDSDASVEIINSSPDAPTDSLSSHVPSSPSQQLTNQPIRYFDDRILEMTTKAWKALRKVEREKILFDFWIQTSYGEGFPWTMNLALQRIGTCYGALGAFMLLFSEGREIRKRGVEWRTISKVKGDMRVEVIWHDQWNTEHRAEGTDKKLNLARNDAAQNALKVVFCREDLRVLQHINSPFIYEGPPSRRVDIDLLWNRLKEAKCPSNCQEEEIGESPGGDQTQPFGGSSNGRRRNPRGSTSSAVQDESNSMRQGDTVPEAEAPPECPEFEGIETQDSESATAESLPDHTGDDPFAEYFSNNEDGTLEIPEWFIEKYLKPPNKPSDIHSEDCDCSISSDAIPEPDKTDKEDAEFPYLPSDRLIGYEYPQEAAAALQLLFEGNEEAEQPKFDVSTYFLAEVQVGDLVFQALGLTEEEAQEAAAAKALEALFENYQDKPSL